MIIFKENYCFEPSTDDVVRLNDPLRFSRFPPTLLLITGSVLTYCIVTKIYNTPFSIVQHIRCAEILIRELRRFFWISQ